MAWHNLTCLNYLQGYELYFALLCFTFVLWIGSLLSDCCIGSQGLCFFLVVIDYAAAFTYFPLLHAFLLPLFVVSTRCCSQLIRQTPIITLFVLPVWYFMISLMQIEEGMRVS